MRYNYNIIKEHKNITHKEVRRYDKSRGESKGNGLAEFQFPEGAVEAVIPVMIIAHVVKGCSHVPA